MPRELPTIIRNATEATSNKVVVISLLTLSSPELQAPICLVDDVFNYFYKGNVHIGMPFQLQNLTDGDAAPTGKLTVVNVDKRIGIFVRSLRKSPQISVEICSAEDWGAALVDAGFTDDDGEAILAKYPSGTPAPAYVANFLQWRDVSGDDATIEANLVSFDTTSEPWPRTRTTKLRTPALFR